MIFLGIPAIFYAHVIPPYTLFLHRIYFEGVNKSNIRFIFVSYSERYMTSPISCFEHKSKILFVHFKFDFLRYWIGTDSRHFGAASATFSQLSIYNADALYARISGSRPYCVMWDFNSAWQPSSASRWRLFVLIDVYFCMG